MEVVHVFLPRALADAVPLGAGGDNAIWSELRLLLAAIGLIERAALQTRVARMSSGSATTWTWMPAKSFST